MEQMGGVRGLILSSLPVLVFVPTNSFFGLNPAIAAALSAATLIFVYSLVRREPLQPAISGFFGVGLSVLIAYWVGSAKGYFLFGIYTSLVYAIVLFASIVVRWPLVGLAWNALEGKGLEWRRSRRAVLSYDLATLCWVVVFGARYLVQSSLYAADSTGWLAAARLGMGWPLTLVAAGVSYWAIRRADAAVEAARVPSPAAPSHEV